MWTGQFVGVASYATFCFLFFSLLVCNAADAIPWFSMSPINTVCPFCVNNGVIVSVEKCFSLQVSEIQADRALVM